MSDEFIEKDIQDIKNFINNKGLTLNTFIKYVSIQDNHIFDMSEQSYNNYCKCFEKIKDEIELYKR